MEALILGDPNEEGLVAKETNLILPNSAERMVQKWLMALDRWFPTTQASGGQASAQSIPQQITPPASQQWRKCQKGTTGAAVRDNNPPAAHLPTQASSWSTAPSTNKTPQEKQPSSQPVIIGLQVAASSSGSATGWECTFQLGDKVLPSNSYLRTWRSSEGGHVSDSLEQALLFPTDMEHYSGCQDDDLVHKLKWHTLAVSFTSTRTLYIYIYICTSLTL